MVKEAVRDVSEDILKEKVDELEKKVSTNQGEVILSYRNIHVAGEDRGCWGGYKEHTHSYFETGIIDGNLVKKKRGDHGFINLPIVSVHSSHLYSFVKDLFIPVERKLSVNPLSVSPAGLSKAKEGFVELGSFEFLPDRGFSDFSFRYHHDFPHLKKIGVFVGDKEVREFMLSEKFEFHWRDLESRIEDFLSLIKNPKEIEKRASEEYFRLREGLAGELIQRVNSLKKVYDNVKGIEERVLKLHRERYYEGMEDMHSWPVWSDDSTFESYKGLRERAKESISGINELLEKGNEIDFVKHPFISGKRIGFPSEIKTQDYLTYVNGDLLPSVNSVLEKLDKHLTEAKKVKV